MASERSAAGNALREAAGDSPLEQEILKRLAQSAVKLTPLDLERSLAGRPGMDRRGIRRAVRALVGRGELDYALHHGRTCLEPSFRRPVRVSRRVVLKPPDCRFCGDAGDVVVNLEGGAAFGTGSHPTTRLALKGLEVVWDKIRVNGGECRALDIGTGSGVLAIAAVLLGARTAWGIDLDPVALGEARANVRLNGLERRIVISDALLETLPPGFDLIAANLRAPTLARMAGEIARQAASPAWLVVSGIRPAEIRDIVLAYRQHRFIGLWQAEEQGWAGLVLAKRAF